MLVGEFGGTGRLRCSDYAPLRLSIIGGSLNFDCMVIVVVLGHEGRRGAGEKDEDVSTPWTMVVDDDHWSTLRTSYHHQQPAERRTRTSNLTRNRLSPIESPHIPMLKKRGSAKLGKVGL